LKFKTNGSIYSAHTSSEVPGVELSTGSLGQGLGYAVGLALSLRMQNRPNRVYCLIGDGESDEGSTWESVEVAAQQKLSNLTVIIDQNRQKVGPIVKRPPNFQKIYQGLGFNTLTIDGHSHLEILQSLDSHKNVETSRNRYNSNNKKPLCVIAQTIKGKGISDLESTPYNHNYTLSLSEFQNAWKENYGNKSDFIDKSASYAR
jgi:transketolase